MFPIRFLAALAFAATVAACSESGTTATPDDTTTTPKTGSTYRIHRYETDETGATIPGSGDTSVTTLVATDATFAGESSVHVFVQGPDTVALLRYDESGDVKYFPRWASTLGSGWITLPIATGGTTERTLRDTSIDFGSGVTGRNTVTLGVSHVSSEQVSVGSESLTAHEVRIRIIEVNPLSAELSLIDTTTQTVWYAPKLGYFVRQQSARSQKGPVSTFVFPTAVAVLTSYELK